jgi:hypothetical protein
MHVFRGLLIAAVLIYLLFFGGPVIGVMVSSWVFMIPVLFIVAILALAAWKIGGLVRR